MSETAVISCENVSKYFQQGNARIDVLDSVDLQINKGESVAIVGMSGAGKSTLLHLMGGLDKPDQGQVFLGEQNLAKLGERRLGELRNHMLGFVYQFHHLLPEFTALENVSMPVRIAGTGQANAEALAGEMLARVGLEQRLNHKPSELSGGERQRAAIARALVTSPACVLADEPTGNLDSKTAAKVYDLFLELNQELGTSLLMVTHDESLASRMQKTLHLKDGKLQA